ncbi:MAG: F0F1 ATP synthase subunit epsilon [Candidatus Obscuribacterales bacterium]|nr:F0F1 ATP synthase subunit epsilon [Candidatus Obscuribacterales bacterium]
MTEQLMTLKVLIPAGVFAQIENVAKVTLNTRDCGNICLLPHRLDCIAALSAGLLTYTEDGKSNTYLAIDDGVMVKTGLNVLVSVRNAFRGDDLKTLHKLIEQQFIDLSQEEQKYRLTSKKLESNLLSRLVELSHE